MAEERSRHDEHAADGLEPTEADSRALAGSVQLLQATLAAPLPPAQAEAEARQRVLDLWRDPALSPRALHKAPYADPASASPLARFWAGVRRLFRR